MVLDVYYSDDKQFEKLLFQLTENDVNLLKGVSDELKKMSVETKRITFVDVLNSDGVLVSGKHHSSSASWHFHDKLINALKQAKTKLEAKKIIANHHKAHMKLDYH